MTLDSRTTTRSDLEGKRLPELHEMAQSMGVSGYQRLRKGDLIDAIITKSGGDGHVEGGAASNGEVTKAEKTDDAAAEASGNGSPVDDSTDDQGGNGRPRGDGERREQGGGGDGDRREHGGGGGDQRHQQNRGGDDVLS